nr:hypothetical protein [Paenibacillus roseus]
MASAWGVAGIFSILFMLFSLIFHIALCVWTYRDATRNGRSFEFALLAVVAVLFFPIVGFIVYLLIRSNGSNNGYRY